MNDQVLYQVGEQDSYQIDVKAVKALAEWKAVFADRVSQKARLIACKCSSQGVVTLSHYRQAASAAVAELATMIHSSDSIDDNERAA